MNADYTTAQMMHDIMAVISDNAPPIIMAAIFIGCVNFVIGWFMHSLSILAKAGKQ